MGSPGGRGLVPSHAPVTVVPDCSVVEPPTSTALFSISELTVNVERMGVTRKSKCLRSRTTASRAALIIIMSA